jgi:6-phosphogluconate dehydrogenase (decarboxylating)
MQLGMIAPYVPNGGEGRWTVVESIDLNVSAMRNQFCGHAVKREE